MARIFITGASGYIGGDLLHALTSTHPEYQLTALVRGSEKVAAVTNAYPGVRVLEGDLDSTSLIEEEASQADVIVHAASNKHMNSVEAIARGLAKKAGPKPGYWIQVSGASLLSIPDILQKRFGEASDKVSCDVDDAAEIRELVHKNADTRVVDEFLLNVSGIKTALVFPPIIYGQSRGPVKQRSVQIPELSRVAIETRQTVQVGRGESIWSNIYIYDLSNVFLKLVKKAVEGTEGDLWNQNGVYFVGTGMLSFGRISELIAEAAYKLGLTDSPAVKSISATEADTLSARGSVFWGTNARSTAQRAQQMLGWAPQGPSVEQEIPLTVRAEAIRLGKL
ncbi:hypothetical protein N7462_009221 [Penicillium macrosclerotiorum]|uniref:uncharacterized protein n=1 Tax=Penicillium macrosclerotiorum TaxID=303699 RepID=UPI0025496288|nr:uncharacterized protein N7462_009221 [Penicillium macrosclerotiorum]KAJ5673782.1 hypothetical protein N7462_009221 [Penicillium macrosclerotiorum]